MWKLKIFCGACVAMFVFISATSLIAENILELDPSEFGYAPVLVIDSNSMKSNNIEGVLNEDILKIGNTIVNIDKVCAPTNVRVSTFQYLDRFTSRQININFPQPKNSSNYYYYANLEWCNPRMVLYEATQFSPFFILPVERAVEQYYNTIIDNLNDKLTNSIQRYYKTYIEYTGHVYSRFDDDNSVDLAIGFRLVYDGPEYNKSFPIIVVSFGVGHLLVVTGLSDHLCEPLGVLDINQDGKKDIIVKCNNKREPDSRIVILYNINPDNNIELFKLVSD